MWLLLWLGCPDPPRPEPLWSCDGREGWYDADRDGWNSYSMWECHPVEVGSRNGDCDDTDASVFPGAPERCGGVRKDHNCDGVTSWFDDADGDGWGGPDFTACEGAVQARGDCDEADPAVSPGASEICGNGLDDDCDLNALPCRFEGKIGASDALRSLPGMPMGAGDLDGDGWIDLVTGATGEDRAVDLFVFHGPVGAVPDEVHDGGTRMALLDLDGDGALDLVLSGDTHERGWEDSGGIHNDGTSTLVLADGATAEFAHDLAWPLPIGYRAAPAADYDGDGAIDLLLGWPDDGSNGASGRALWYSASGERW